LLFPSISQAQETKTTQVDTIVIERVIVHQPNNAEETLIDSQLITKEKEATKVANEKVIKKAEKEAKQFAKDQKKHEKQVKQFEKQQKKVASAEKVFRDLKID
jgi:hypothetical protein